MKQGEYVIQALPRDEQEANIEMTTSWFKQGEKIGEQRGEVRGVQLGQQCGHI